MGNGPFSFDRLAAAAADVPVPCRTPCVRSVAIGASGIGSALLKTADQMLEAAPRRVQPIGRWRWADDVAECRGKRGYECVLEPLVTCAPHAGSASCAKPVHAAARTTAAQLQRLVRPNAFLRSWLRGRYAAFWAGSGAAAAASARRALIAVHVRWGDKLIEDRLVPIRSFLDAVLSTIRQHRRQGHGGRRRATAAAEGRHRRPPRPPVGPPHLRRPSCRVACRLVAPVVFLSSEDARAVELFHAAANASAAARAARVAVVSYPYSRPRYNCPGLPAERLERALIETGVPKQKGRSWRDAARRMGWSNHNVSGECVELQAYARRNQRAGRDPPLLLVALLNLFLALEASHLICGPVSSAWCQLLRGLAQARHQRVTLLGAVHGVATRSRP